MFAAPLSFDGRIGRLEYLLTLLIVFTAILAFIYRPYLINADIEIFINNIEYDYPQFALPLYNLCSNVGLYETAAITNRSNILSPKYLRLNL